MLFIQRACHPEDEDDLRADKSGPRLLQRLHAEIPAADDRPEFIPALGVTTRYRLDGHYANALLGRQALKSLISARSFVRPRGIAAIT
jgi:hypothetical protein